MAITPVHSSSDTNANNLQQVKQSNQLPKATSDVAAKQAQTQQTQQPSQTQHVQAPKPVINSQGQKTGQILNATA
jgi:hypothetical protein